MYNWNELTEFAPVGGWEEPWASGEEGVDWDWEAVFDETQALIGKRRKRRV